MIDNLSQLTRQQSKCQQWFRYRAGRITASRFKQVLLTDTNKPSLSLLQAICYPKTSTFSTAVSRWDCKHEQEALKAYKAQMATHIGICLSECGQFLSKHKPFLGASPDSVVECDCCGKGVVEVKCSLCVEKSSLEEAAKRNTINFCLDKVDEKFRINSSHSYYCQCQLQLYVTKCLYCDFVVWTTDEVHTEQIVPNIDLLESILAEDFLKLCILPELLGKWFTRKAKDDKEIEEDNGSWCFCKEIKGGDMVQCDNSTCRIKWFHLDCVRMSEIPIGRWLCSDCKTALFAST